jgi:hypothetical protein
MSLGNWLRPPRHLLLIFLVILLLPTSLLVVSGWRLVRQEELRAREQQQAQMADLVIAELRQRIAGIGAQLRESRAFAMGPMNRPEIWAVSAAR